MNLSTSVCRRVGASIALMAAYATLFGTHPANAAGMVSGPSISFASKVSATDRALPLFRLERTAPPTAFVTQAIRTANTGPLAMEKNRFVARDAARVVRAFSDPRTGEAQIFPDMRAPGGPAPSPAVATSAAGSVFARADIIPKDVTQARLGDATRVFAASATHEGKAAHPLQAPKVLFTYVPAVRYAAGLQVFGKGSHATVAVGNDGSIRGLVRRWQAAAPAGMVKPTTTSAGLVQAITAQVQPLAKLGRIVIESVKPAYYDGDANYLQPVYVFTATIHPSGRGISNDHVRGFVPVGTPLEPIPLIGRGASGTAPAASQSAGRTVRPMDANGGIAFGEYANRDGTMLDMANSYNNGFTSVAPWTYGPPIDRDQWYWAYSYQVQTYANYYLNAMQVAYTQPHGDWYVNTTYSNDLGSGDPWYVTNIGQNGNPGLGAASGGSLATWIIDSCEVIPSFYDLGYTTGNGYNAFNAWWPVFQGLHRALGFRTEMLLGQDDMNYDIAQNMAMGVDPDSAFYNGVAAYNFGTYQDYHLNNMWVHYDRVSIMVDTRNEGESIYSTYPQSASGQLRNVWMDN